MAAISRGAEGSRRDARLARDAPDLVPAARRALLQESHPLAGLSLLLLVVVLGAGYLWARDARLDVVTRGEGQVIPSSREQVIQSLEGGILAELAVREGDVVEQGQVLARLDDTRFGASYREGQRRLQALRAAVARLRAEAEGTRLEFPAGVPDDLRALETKLYEARRNALGQSIAALERSLRLATEELELTEPLVGRGIVSEVELLRLRRQVNELRGQIADRRNSFRAAAGAALAEKEAELGALAEISSAREDQVRRTVIRSPVRGTVKDIRVTTLGGVVSPGSPIMTVVPLEDQLLVEARIRPRDVAFLRPGLPTTVKITAYDYSIYGGLDGELVHISADTIADPARPGQRFYRVRVRTDRAWLDGPDGPLPIIPGMVATVEVLTGHKTVLDYVLKPVLKAKENALRER